MRKAYEKNVLEPQKKLVERYSKIMRMNPNIKLSNIEQTREPLNYDVFSKIEKMESPMVKIEENNWKRHNEEIDAQLNNLSILEEILIEQKSTSRMTKIIIILTVSSIIVSIIIAYLTIKL